MAKTNKFEEMLERLVNEDVQGARDLFHEIVVEKSRDIYESLLENDMYDEDEDLEEEFDLDESDEDDEEDLDENWDLEESEEDDEEDLEEDWDIEEGYDDEEDFGDIGGDPTDDLESEVRMDGEGMDDMDMTGDDMDMNMSDDPVEDKIDTMNQKLDDLAAELQDALAGLSNSDDDDDEMPEMPFDDEGADDEEGEEEMPFGDEGSDDEGADAEEEMPADDGEEEEDLSEAGMMKSMMKKLDEYTHSVSAENDKPGKGDNGTGSSLHGGKSPELKASGSTKNIGQKHVESPSAKAKGFTGGDKKGELRSGGYANDGKTSGSKLSANGKGHGAEKKGKNAPGEGKAGSVLPK